MMIMLTPAVTPIRGITRTGIVATGSFCALAHTGH